MKKTIKILALILVAAMILCLAACGNNNTTKTETNQAAEKVIEIKKGEYLYKTLGDENLENIQKNLPSKVTFYMDQIGYAKTAEFTNQADIKKIVEMFVKIKVGGETDEFEADQYNNITFEFADGSTSKIPLCCKNFEFSTDNDYRMYTLENFDELWAFMESSVKDSDGIIVENETDTHENDKGDGIVETYDQETVMNAYEETVATEPETEEEENAEEAEYTEEEFEQSEE